VGKNLGKKIAIVGAGAVGGYAGAHMVQAGEDMTFIDPWPAHVEHMRAHGLRVTHAVKEPEFSVPVRALHVTDAQALAKEKPVDIAFVCMKSYDTAWAAMLIKQYLAPDGFVVSLQNCMNEEAIAGVVGWGKTLGCIASSITVNLPEPGHIHRGAAKHGAAHTVFRAGEVHGQQLHRLLRIGAGFFGRVEAFPKLLVAPIDEGTGDKAPRREANRRQRIARHDIKRGEIHRGAMVRKVMVLAIARLMVRRRSPSSALAFERSGTNAETSTSPSPGAK
jgi:Ketopantoate reductase PanE/ApbA